MNALDDLHGVEELPEIYKSKADQKKSYTESKYAKRNRLITHQAQMELNVLKHVIQRQPGEHKDELKKHTKHLRYLYFVLNILNFLPF